MGDRPASIAVIGLGNVLLSDDGFGPFVVEQLRAQWDLPEYVTLIDGGTPGLGLVTLLADCDVAILIDSVAATGSPGELRCYSGEELQALPLRPRVSPHDPAVQEALGITQFLGHGPGHALLIGVIPASLEVATDLSAPVLASAQAAVALVVAELARAGAIPARRDKPRTPDVWWELHARGASRLCVDARSRGMAGRRRRSSLAPRPPARVRALPPRSLQRALEYIEGNLDAELCLAGIAAAVRLSPHYFAKSFRLATGITPHQFVIRRRIEHAKRLLADRQHSIAAVAYSVGFSNQSHLTSVFRRLVGVTPLAFRQGAMTVRRARVAVAGTDPGA